MNYYNKIKNEIIDIEIYKKVKDYSKNKRELEGYYKIGKLLIKAQGGEFRTKYGDGLIKEYSKKLTEELGKGYTITSLKRMRQFYLIIKKGATLSHLSSWSNYVELLSIKDINKINYYIKISEQQNLGVRELRKKIKSIYHNKTIGIIICKENNSYVIKYCSNPNIYQTTYLIINEEVLEYI